MCSRYVIQVGGRRSDKSGGSARWGQTKRPKTQGNEKIKIGVYNVEGRGRGMGGRCDSSEREKKETSRSQCTWSAVSGRCPLTRNCCLLSSLKKWRRTKWRSGDLNKCGKVGGRAAICRHFFFHEGQIAQRQPNRFRCFQLSWKADRFHSASQHVEGIVGLKVADIFSKTKIPFLVLAVIYSVVESSGSWFILCCVLLAMA